MFSVWYRSSKSPSKGNTPKSNVLQLLRSLLPLFKLNQPHPHHLLLQSLLQTLAQKGKWITSLLVCWTTSTQQDLDLLDLEVLEAAEPWPREYSSLHVDLHCLHRTTILRLVHHQPVWPAKVRQELVKVSDNSGNIHSRAAHLRVPFLLTRLLFFLLIQGDVQKKDLQQQNRDLEKFSKFIAMANFCCETDVCHKAENFYMKNEESSWLN